MHAGVARHCIMATSLICTILVLAAPGALALRPAAEIQAAGAAMRGAAQGQLAAASATSEHVLSGGSTRELLTRQLRSRAEKPPRPPRTRKPRGTRQRPPKPQGAGQAPASRSRRPRGVQKDMHSSGGKGKASGEGSGHGPKSGKKGGKAATKPESLCAKHVVEKEIVREKGPNAHVLASAVF